jgi:O-antigen/teichoic acid export membrane protein
MNAVTRTDDTDRSGFRPALLLTAGRSVATAFTLMIPIVLARRLPPEIFGLYKQLFLIHVTLYVPAQMGMAESLYYFLPLYPERCGRLIRNVLSVLGVCALGCLALLTMGRETVAHLIGNANVAPLAPVAGLFLSLMLMSAVLEITMIARRHYRWAFATYLGTDVVRAILLIGPVLLGAGVRGLLWGACLSAALRIVVAVVYLRKEFGGELVFDRSLLRAQFGYALPFQAAVLIETAQATLHQYVVSYQFDAATFALYSVGCLQIPIIDLLAGPAGNVMMVRMAEARRRGDTAGFHEAFLETTRKLALFFFPLLGVLMAVAPDLIVSLFTSTYAASVPIFRVWSLVVVLAIFQADGLMRALAQTRFLVVVNVVRLALIAATVVPLLHVLGLMGPVVATLLGITLAKVMMLARYRSQVGLRTSELLPWNGLLRIGLVAAGALVVTMMAGVLMVAPHPVRLLALSAIYVVSYGVMVLASGLLTVPERQGLFFWRTASPAYEEPSQA